MDTSKAEVMAKELMALHGLEGEGWCLLWSYSYGWAAKCVRPVKWVILSVPYIEENDEAGVREIVLHEIAHALTTGTLDEAHNEEWRVKLKEIGGSGLVMPTLVIPSMAGQAGQGYGSMEKEIYLDRNSKPIDIDGGVSTSSIRERINSKFG